jgi:hypothetical protein
MAATRRALATGGGVEQEWDDAFGLAGGIVLMGADAFDALGGGLFELLAESMPSFWAASAAKSSRGMRLGMRRMWGRRKLRALTLASAVRTGNCSRAWSMRKSEWRLALRGGSFLRVTKRCWLDGDEF